MTSFAYPPIPAGEKIFSSEQTGLIYPVSKNGHDVDCCNFAIIKDGTLVANSIIKISDGDLHRASSLSKISDPQTGKEKFVVFDDDYINIIENVRGKYQLTKKKRADKFVGKNAFFCVSPVTHSETAAPSARAIKLGPIINPTVKTRSFYCGYELDSRTSEIVLYDLLQDDFSAVLPFLPETGKTIEVSLISRITSFKETYVVFVTAQTDTGDQYGVHLYAIKEADLIEKRNSLKISDFINVAVESNGYPVRLFADHFYYDTENTGSSQLVLGLNSVSGETLSLLMFEIDKSGALKNTASLVEAFSGTSLRSFVPVKERMEIVSYIMSELGPVFLVNNISLSAYEIATASRTFQENSSLITLQLCMFDPKEKVFEKQSSVYTHAYFPINESDAPDFSKKAPWITHCHLTPNVGIFKNPSGGLTMYLTSATLNFRYIVAELQAFFQLTGIVTSADPNISTGDGTKAYFGSLKLPIVQYGDALVFDGVPDNLLINVTYNNDIGSNAMFVPEKKPISELTFNDRGPLVIEFADLSGDSIVLGEPTLTFASSITQFTGLYRALPFQQEFKYSSPYISVSSSEGIITGVVDAVISSWQAGYSASGSGTIEGITLGLNFGQNFGGHNMDMDSDTTGITLHSMEDLSSYDLVTGYGADFYLWEYPAYRHATDTEPFDTVSILVPIGYSQQGLDAKEVDLAYLQDYEIGSLLTYVGSSLPGYDESTVLFRPITVTVTSDAQGGMTVIYDENNSTSHEKSRSTDTSLNAGASLGFGGALTISGHYTESNVKNHSSHTTQSSDYSITFHSGTVKDSQYEYKITPIVYRHKDTQVIIVSSMVELDGLSLGWKEFFSKYDVRLMKSFPFTMNKELRAFSRSIRFDENADGSVNINVHLFNNSLYPAPNVKCDIYLGKANFNTKPVKLPDVKLGSLNVEGMDIVERKIVTLENQKIPQNSYITVVVTVNDLSDSTQYFWGAYPYSYANGAIKKLLAKEKKEEK